MKMMMRTYQGSVKKVILFFLMISLSLMGMATTYYVSNTGIDSNSGLSTTSPWQTLAKVNAFTFSAGDQILFQRGCTFYGSLTVKQSGTSGNPITFGAYGTGANPVISGFTTVTSWTNLGNNIWESTNTVSALLGCNMVTINGVNTPMGRYPKVTDSNKGYYTYQSHSGQTSITSSSLTGTPNWTGAEVVIRNQAFHLKRSVVTSQSGATINFGDIGEGFTDGNGFFFQNDIRCCTQQNEWVFNPATDKIRMYSTSLPANVKVASVENLITVNANYLVFTNLTFTGANGCAFYCWDHTPRYNHVTITNCNFSLIGVSAIYTLINNLLVLNNTITDCNITAIETSFGSHVEITGNSVKNIGLFHGMRNNKVYTMCNGAVDCGNVTGFTVKNNNIQNIGFNGISFWASDTVLVQNNFVDTFCSVLDDGGGIYTYSAAGSICHAVKIKGNICINGIAAVEGSTFVHNAHGIYLDQGSANIELSYNSLANTTGSGIHWTSAGNNNAHHNTVFNASENQFSSSYYGGTAPIPTGDIIKNNILVSKVNNSSSMDYQKCLYYYFAGTNSTSLILAAAALDSNYYARPIADDKVFFVAQSVWANSFKTLADWQTFSGQDIHSHKSAQTVTSVNDLQFVYNETNAVKTVALSQPMVDVKGTKYAGSVSLQPFTSLILMKNYSAAEINAFTIPGQTGNSVINSTLNTIGVTMPYGTSPTNLVACFTIPTGATAKVGTTTQVSSTTTNNFTNPVVYAVTAQDGVTTKNWTVTVSVSPNTQTDITAFTLPGQTGSSVINTSTNTIGITLPFGSALTSLVANYTLSAGATAKIGTTTQVSGITANNFTSPVVYAVTAQDGVTTKNWTVTVSVSPNTQTDITAFTLPGQTGSSVINTSTNTIGITLPFGSSLTSLVVNYTLSAGATAKIGTTTQVSGTTTNNFTSPVVYTVTAQDGVTTKNWTVTVTVATAFASGGTYELIARHSGKVIGIKGGSTSNSALAEQETYTGAASQQFVITDLGTGYYKISPTSVTSKALDVSGLSVSNGASVIQYSYNGGTDQQWKLVSVGGGYYQIINLNSKKCLDVTNASTADGTIIQQYTCGTGANQQFSLSRLKSESIISPENNKSSSIVEGTNTSSISLFPNPSEDGKFFVDLSSISSDQQIDINIFSIKGDRVYYQKAQGNNQVEVNSGLKTGIYIVRISGGQTNITKKLIVE
jgi:Ricin-type beta-trefoil lectin domain.